MEQASRGPVPRRRSPLVAPGRTSSPGPAPDPGSERVRSAGRGLWIGLGAGLAAAAGVGALIFAVAAIPLFLFAQVAPDGTDRPDVRTALIASIYAGVAIGAVTGVAVGIWAGRGGRLPTDRTPFLQVDDPS